MKNKTKIVSRVLFRCGIEPSQRSDNRVHIYEIYARVYTLTLVLSDFFSLLLEAICATISLLLVIDQPVGNDCLTTFRTETVYFCKTPIKSRCVYDT